MWITPHEQVERIARDCYARLTKSRIPPRIRYWMWDHGLVSEATKARYENTPYDFTAIMTRLGANDVNRKNRS